MSDPAGMPAPTIVLAGRPLRDKCIVKRILKQEIGGLAVPDSDRRSRPVKGRVLAVGSGHLNLDGSLTPLEVKAGDVIHFSLRGCTPVELEDINGTRVTNLYVVPESSIEVAVAQAGGEQVSVADGGAS